MSKRSPFRYFKASPKVIRLALMLFVRFPLSLRNVEDVLHKRRVAISHETVRFRPNGFGPMFVFRIRRMRSLQKFTSNHLSVHNHSNQKRHLYSRGNFKLNRSATLTEWRKFCSGQVHAF
ncbi:hypothetical protein [Yoonia sp.]|uniref:hypothetical protein n=1 Tax=Yoonia sp. TaxID=2212373 RepID=UPI00358F60FE